MQLVVFDQSHPPQGQPKAPLIVQAVQEIAPDLGKKEGQKRVEKEDEQDEGKERRRRKILQEGELTQRQTLSEWRLQGVQEWSSPTSQELSLSAEEIDCQL